MFKNVCLHLLILFFFTAGLSAQQIESWKAYSSFSQINSIQISSEGVIYSATSGGLFAIDNQQISGSYTTLDGLHRFDPRIAYLNTSSQLFLGYSDGVIDVLDTSEGGITSIYDVQRVDRFSTKSINDFKQSGEKLYVGTDFGVINIDMNNLTIRDSYLKIGSFDLGVAINALEVVEDTIFVATNEGLARASMSDELSISSNWISDGDPSGLPTSVISDIAYYNGELYALVANDVYKKSEGVWELVSQFGTTKANEIGVDSSGSLLIVDNYRVTIVDAGGEVNTITLNSSTRIQTVSLKDDYLWIGTLDEGLIRYSLATAQMETFLPQGPFSNYFKGLNFDKEKGVLLAASTNETARNSIIDFGKGYSIFDGENWESYNVRNNEVLSGFRFTQTFTSLITPDYYYIGSWGQGIARHNRETNEIDVFNETNSTLRGWVDDDPNYQVISGLGSDANGDIWAVSRYGQTPLYYQQPGDNDWVAIPKPTAASGNEYVSLFVDSNNQKWITLENAASGSGAGLLVVNTGDPMDASDDVAVRLTEDENSGSLPNNKVNSVIEDKNGEIWIGTERGISRFLFPEFIISTQNSSERRSQWLINADTSASSRYLLRDINVSAMAVNGANQKWIGTANQGLWLLDAEGSQILNHLTTENSPLISNTIFSITIDENTGEVFIATDLGLQSYMEVAKSPFEKMKNLKVYPNPFVYEKNDRMFVDGLSEETVIRILGADGTVVQELEGSGGRIEWNGLDYMGKRLGSGVYIIVALDRESNSTGIGKVVIIN